MEVERRRLRKLAYGEGVIGGVQGPEGPPGPEGDPGATGAQGPRGEPATGTPNHLIGYDEAGNFVEIPIASGFTLVDGVLRLSEDTSEGEAWTDGTLWSDGTGWV